MIVPAMASGDPPDLRQTISPGKRNAGTLLLARASGYQHRVSYRPDDRQISPGLTFLDSSIMFFT
jgi:hypothetical protein